MVDDANGKPTAAAVDVGVIEIVQEILAGVPGGCTWLLPVEDGPARIVDFQIGAVSGHGRDIYQRGASRVGARLSELYPTMVDGALWQMYRDALTMKSPRHLPDFRYEDGQAGIIAQSHFDVSAYPALGGLLVWWQRIDEEQRRLERTEMLGRLGWAEYDLSTGKSDWSLGMYRIFDRDPALGPLSRSEQAAALMPEDRGLSETAWQTLDSGAASDVTVRFSSGGKVKHLRVLSDVARDAAGTPLKIYAVVQDVTNREDSRTEIERLTDQLRSREMTALAEHRLAGQLQNMIQPVPTETFALADLDAAVHYLPAEKAVQVGGDWYHAETLPDGRVILAIGDVAGHGLEAATGMAHLRFGLVAWLSIGIDDPATLLGHLNQLSHRLAITGTALIAMYDPGPKTMTWARAGHPAPLVARGGSANAMDRPPGLLLGADPETVYAVAAFQLMADDIVLFYTDGLVERRASNTGERLEAVRRSLSQISSAVDDRSLDSLQAGLREPSPDDDTCTLAVRVRR